MSVAAFTMSAGMLAGSVLLYTRIPSLTKYYMSELTLEMTKVMTNMMPGQINEAMPEPVSYTHLTLPTILLV